MQGIIAQREILYPNIKHQECEYFEKVKCFDSGLIGSNRGGVGGAVRIGTSFPTTRGQLVVVPGKVGGELVRSCLGSDKHKTDSRHGQLTFQ